MNYLQFYPSLKKLETSITSVSLRDNSFGKTIELQILVDNPTDYQGFSVPEAILRVYFSNATSSFFKYPTFFGSETQDYPLGPHSQVSPQVVIRLNQTNTAALESFVIESRSTVYANVTLTVQIGTFLNPVIGSVLLDQIQAVPLSTS